MSTPTADPTEAASSKHRRLGAPFLIAGLIAIIVGVVCQQGDQVPWWVAPMTTVTAIAAAVGIGRLPRPGTRDQRAWCAWGLALTGTWAGWVLWHQGLDRNSAAALLALTLLLGSPWWWPGILRPDTEPEPPTEDDEGPGAFTPNIGDATKVWTEFVSGPGQAIPGSTLTGISLTGHDPTTWSATVLLPPGQIKPGAAVGQTELVASSFKVSERCISLEKAERASEIRLTVAPSDPLNQIHEFTAPSFDPATGLFMFARYADGSPSKVQLFKPGSGKLDGVPTGRALHGLIAGGSGMGKSRGLDLLLTEARHSGTIVPWVIDPQSGQSLPAWVDNADWYARNEKEGLQLLRAVGDVMKAREAYLSSRGMDAFPMSPQFPMLLLVVDETRIVASDDDAAKLLQLISLAGSKTGVSMWNAIQHPTVEQFGKAPAMRSQATAWNAILYRTGDRSSGQMIFDDLPMPTNRIPKTQGLGFVKDHNDRLALARTLFVKDAHQWAQAGTPASLDDISARAAGPIYADRRGSAHVRERTERAVAAAARAAAEGGSVDPFEATQGWDDVPSVERPASAAMGSAGGDTIVGTVVTSSTAAEVEDFPAEDSPTGGGFVRDLVIPDGATATETVAFVVHWHGKATTQQIKDTIAGLPEHQQFAHRSIAAGVRDATANGSIVKVAHGLYSTP